MGAGLSCARVGAAADLSGTHIARIERAEVPGVASETLAIVGAVVGLDVRTRTYPGPDPLRDQGQVTLITRLRQRVPPTVPFRTEVTLPVAGDLRAWDAWLGLRSHDGVHLRGLPCEAETRFVDAQASIRRWQRKLRDAGEAHLLVVVADTHTNRRAVAAARAVVRDMFPVSARAVLGALAEGRHPGGSGLIFL